MKIFISWSGKLSQSVAEKLRFWLKDVIQEVRPFVSSQDVQPGKVWMTELSRELEESSVGILCLTKENLNAKWLLFESGAIFKKFGASKICTLLINVTPNKLGSPLSAFQSTIFEKNDLLKLVKSIYSEIKHPAMTEKELEKQFDRCWDDFAAEIKLLLSQPHEHKNEMQELSEELLLPVIYRETIKGELEIVFEWLAIAKEKGLLDIASELSFIEAALARIAGKRNASKSLQQHSSNINWFSCKAQLEFLYSRFAAGARLNDVSVDHALIETAHEHIKKNTYTLLSLWNLREANMEKAKVYFELSKSGTINEDAGDYYRAIPMGILCFAFGEGALGEKYFDLVRSTIKPNEGYPFVPLVSDFDRLFVNTCIGHEPKNIDESRIRGLRGHAWVLIKYAELMRQHPEVLNTLIDRTLQWRSPLTQQAVSSRLLQFEKRLMAFSGPSIN